MFLLMANPWGHPICGSEKLITMDTQLVRQFTILKTTVIDIFTISEYGVLRVAAPQYFFLVSKHFICVIFYLKLKKVVALTLSSVFSPLKLHEMCTVMISDSVSICFQLVAIT